MLFVNQKYKPIITKPVQDKKEIDFNSSIMPSIQGKGLNELVQKVKELKVKEMHKKRNTSTNSKISFD
jgi:hypothetical protein